MQLLAFLSILHLAFQPCESRVSPALELFSEENNYIIWLSLVSNRSSLLAPSACTENRIMMHARSIELDWANFLAML